MYLRTVSRGNLHSERNLLIVLIEVSESWFFFKTYLAKNMYLFYIGSAYRPYVAHLSVG